MKQIARLFAFIMILFVAGVVFADNGIPVKTGQTTQYITGDDGTLQKGITLPTPRFTDNNDGTVTDNLTGLIWLRNANAFGNISWSAALLSCNSLTSGQADLSDGSNAGDWRLPNIIELQSLIDYGNINPALPTRHYFVNLAQGFYWSGTTSATGNGSNAWQISMYSGLVGTYYKPDGIYVWPVRDGN